MTFIWIITFKMSWGLEVNISWPKFWICKNREICPHHPTHTRRCSCRGSPSVPCPVCQEPLPSFPTSQGSAGENLLPSALISLLFSVGSVANLMSWEPEIHGATFIRSRVTAFKRRSTFLIDNFALCSVTNQV